MAGFSRIAAYHPPGRIDGHPRAGWDEDGFTMAVAAIERLVPSPGGPAVPARVLLVGTFPSTAEANLARFLGAAIPIERTGTGASGLAAAIRSLDGRTGDEGAVLLLAADVGADRSDGSASDARSEPDAAVAALIDTPRGSSFSSPSGPGTEPGPSATEAFFAWHRRERGEPPDRWVGDWSIGAASSAAAAGALRPRPTLPAVGPFSQGAYVPMARYEENLPSRWRFAAELCSACAATNFPVRGRCRQCGRRDTLDPTFLLTDGGQVLATTTIGPGGQPTEFDDQVASGGPYEVALVELVPGVRVTLQVTDVTAGALRIGDRVRTSLRRLYPMEGEWRYGRKAIRTAGTGR